VVLGCKELSLTGRNFKTQDKNIQATRPSRGQYELKVPYYLPGLCGYRAQMMTFKVQVPGINAGSPWVTVNFAGGNYRDFTSLNRLFCIRTGSALNCHGDAQNGTNRDDTFRIVDFNQGKNQVNARVDISVTDGR
jgi:hypothetical protein